MNATKQRPEPEIKATHIHEPDLERCVLGSLFAAPRNFERVSWLRSEDFYGEISELFESMRRCWEHDHYFDLPLIKADLIKHGRWEILGGPQGAAYNLIQSCIEAVGSGALLESYARGLREKTRIRQLLGLRGEIKNLVSDRESPEAIIAHIRRSLEAVAGGAQAASAPAKQVVIEALDQINKLAEHDDRSGVISTGIADFDRLCGGLYPGEMIVLAARPGVGKTALALQIAVHTALRQRPVYFASLEMRRAELMVRALATKSKVSGALIRSGLRDKEHFAPIHQAAARISEDAMLWIDDRPRMSVGDIRCETHRLHQEHGLALIVVDYLARLRPENPRAQRYEQIGEMTRDLKCLACELRVPLLLLAQLNREAEGGVPSMRHLRESGDIEADADVIGLLYPDTETTAKFRIEKNRNGKCAELELQWNADLTEFWCLSNHEWANDEPPKLKHLPAIF